MVQNQNLDRLVISFSLGDVICEMKAFSPYHNAADLWIDFKARGNRGDIELQCCKDVVPTTLAEGMLKSLCESDATFTADPDDTLCLGKPGLTPEIPIVLRTAHCGPV